MRVLVTGDAHLPLFLGRRLVERGHALTVIHEERETCNALARSLRATVFHGDATDPEILEEAGAGSMDVVLSLTSSDARNIAVCQHARHRFRVPRVLAIVNDPDNEEVFHQLGVDAAFSPVRLVARMLEERADFGAVVDMIPVAEGRVTVTEARLTARSPAMGHRLRELTLPPEALIGCILRDSRPVIPRGETELLEGDRLLIICSTESQRATLDVVVGQSD